MNMTCCRLLVVGFDGMDAGILFGEEWRGRWPALEAVWMSGNAGRCAAEIAATGPSWTTIYTGRSCREHGVHDAWGRDIEGSMPFYRVTYPFFWDWMNAAGLTTGILNLPVTYPPRAVNGYMVSGFPAPDGVTLTYPADFDLPDGYVVDVTNLIPVEQRVPGVWCRSMDREQALSEMRRVAECKLDLLARGPVLDVMAVGFVMIDHMGHFATGDDTLSWLLRAYDYCDELLARARQSVEPVWIALVSDHGFDENGHTHGGVFAACGPGLAVTNAKYRTIDVLPMLLEMAGIDGGESKLEWTYPPQTVAVDPRGGASADGLSAGERDQLERQLSALGYLE